MSRHKNSFFRTAIRLLNQSFLTYPFLKMPPHTLILNYHIWLFCFYTWIFFCTLLILQYNLAPFWCFAPCCMYWCIYRNSYVYCLLWKFHVNREFHCSLVHINQSNLSDENKAVTVSIECQRKLVPIVQRNLWVKGWENGKKIEIVAGSPVSAEISVFTVELHRQVPKNLLNCITNGMCALIPVCLGAYVNPFKKILKCSELFTLSKYEHLIVDTWREKYVNAFVCSLLLRNLHMTLLIADSLPALEIWNFTVKLLSMNTSWKTNILQGWIYLKKISRKRD